MAEKSVTQLRLGALDGVLKEPTEVRSVVLALFGQLISQWVAYPMVSAQRRILTQVEELEEQYLTGMIEVDVERHVQAAHIGIRPPLQGHFRILPFLRYRVEPLIEALSQTLQSAVELCDVDRLGNHRHVELNNLVEEQVEFDLVAKYREARGRQGFNCAGWRLSTSQTLVGMEIYPLINREANIILPRYCPWDTHRGGIPRVDSEETPPYW